MGEGSGLVGTPVEQPDLVSRPTLKLPSQAGTFLLLFLKPTCPKAWRAGGSMETQAALPHHLHGAP